MNLASYRDLFRSALSLTLPLELFFIRDIVMMMMMMMIKMTIGIMEMTILLNLRRKSWMILKAAKFQASFLIISFKPFSA